MIAPCQRYDYRYHNTRHLLGTWHTFLFRKALGRQREQRTPSVQKRANALNKCNLLVPAVSWLSGGCVAYKSLIYRDYQSRLFVIERGESYGRSLSLKITGRKDSDHAACKPNAVFHPCPPPASSLSSTAAAVGHRCPLASHASPGRKSYPAGGTRPSGAPLVRASRTDLARGLSVASRSRSWGAAVNRQASPRTPTFFGGYSHD